MTLEEAKAKLNSVMDEIFEQRMSGFVSALRRHGATQQEVEENVLCERSIFEDVRAQALRELTERFSHDGERLN